MLEQCTFEESMATPSWAKFIEFVDGEAVYRRIPPAMWGLSGGASFFAAADKLWAEILDADRPA